jgi:Flp pilus assembly protein TadG
MVRRRNDQNRRGAATVEFALVLPIFFFAVIFPLLEFGRALMVANSIAATAEVGARAAVLPGSTNTTVTTAVTNNLAALGISGANAPVIKVNGSVANVSTAVQGDQISVTVSVSYSNTTWLPVSMCNFLGNATLSSTQTMRRE